MSSKLSYVTIKDKVKEDLKRDGRSFQQIENHIAAFNSFAKVLNLNISDEPLVFKDFEITLTKYFERAGLGIKTIPGRKSQLKKFHRAYLILSLNESMPPNFTERLNYLIERDGRYSHLLARLSDINANTLRGWKIGKCLPSPYSIDKVKRLEQILGVPDGTLYRTVKHASGNNLKILSNAPKTEYMLRLKQNQNEQYFFKLKDWPEELQAQWRIIEEHFTDDMSPELPRHKDSHWGSETAGMRLAKLESFFGFLLLDANCSNPCLRGLGFNVSDLHVTLAADKKLVKRYINFKKERNKLVPGCTDKTNKGFNSHGIKDVLTSFNAYIHPAHGIFRYSDELKGKIDTDEKSWDDYCDDTHKRYVHLLCETEWVKTRDPMDRISYYLESPSPKKYLKRLVTLMKQDNLVMPQTTKINTQALIHFSRYFLCAFLFANPLRIKMFTIMKREENLYFRKSPDGKSKYHAEAGDWYLRFRSMDFKNSKHAAKNAYHVRCASWLSPIIEEYLDVYRPLTIGADDCDYIFRPCSHVPRGYKKTLSIKTYTLSRWVDFATKKYLKGFGFRPQAFRHIIAHDYIKNHPHGFQIVASILHDTLQTVLDNYGHLSQHDWFENYNTYTEKLMEDFNDE